MSSERKRAAAPSRILRKCAAPLLIGASYAASAQDEQASWSLDLGTRYTDNVERVDTNEQSETVGIAGVAIGLNTDRRRLDTRIGADLRYEEYFDTDIDSEVEGGLDGTLAMTFVPEHFVWVVQDNFGQISRNRQSADSPDNRQNINYFSTGPDLTLSFGARTALELSGRWSDAYYEDTTEDNETLFGSAAIARQISSTTSVSLNGTTSEIEYDDATLYIDYEVQEGFLRLDMSGARTTLALDGGVSRLEQAGTTSQEGVVARLDLSRLVAARSRIRLVAGTEPSNTADTFRRDQSLGGVTAGSDAAVAAGDAYQSDYVYLTWTSDWERSALTVALNARSEDHEVFTEKDRDQYRATLAWSRVLSPTVSIDLRGAYLDEEFVETGFTFEEWGAGAGLGWRFGRQLSLRVRVDHFVGSSDDGSRDYTENRAYLGLSYSSRS